MSGCVHALLQKHMKPRQRYQKIASLSLKTGIEYVAGEEAPLVFYSGFTRSFLAGEQGTSAQWLQKSFS